MTKFKSIDEFIDWINDSEAEEVALLLEQYGFEFEEK